MKGEQFHRSGSGLLQAMMPFVLSSSRSGAMMPVDITPIQRGAWWVRPSSRRGQIKHAGDVRQLRKRQRRRAFLRSCRG